MSTATADNGAAARKSIMRVALILTVLTAFEFFIAFTWEWFAGALGIHVETMRTMKNLLFYLLTIFKAYYIVSEFMHLGHEIRRLSLTVILPFIFIIWLIIGMIIEGAYYGRETKKEYEGNLYQTPTQVEQGPQFASAATIRGDMIRYE